MNNDAYTKAYQVLNSEEHKVAQRIVHMAHAGVNAREISQMLGISPKKVMQILL